MKREFQIQRHVHLSEREKESDKHVNDGHLPEGCFGQPVAPFEFVVMLLASHPKRFRTVCAEHCRKNGARTQSSTILHAHEIVASKMGTKGCGGSHEHLTHFHQTSWRFLVLFTIIIAIAAAANDERFVRDTWFMNQQIERRRRVETSKTANV